MSPTRTIPTIALALCAAAAPAWPAGPACRAESGERTLPLVELYTSEGCDSCPPADRWVARTFPPAAATSTSVLAFHVDYWDRLGWPDRFARPAWSSRQQDIARSGRNAVVYTPQVMLQGHDFPEWRGATAARDIAAAGTGSARAAIALEARHDDRRLAVSAIARVPVAANRPGSRLVVAYTDSGHVTDVKRGENAGVELRHDHVVRALATSAPADASGAISLQASFDIPAEAGTHPRLVAFVERDAKREVLQSVSLPLEACGR
jgi:hypothetical protein